jgi:hypothetical protein
MYVDKCKSFVVVAVRVSIMVMIVTGSIAILMMAILNTVGVGVSKRGAALSTTDPDDIDGMTIDRDDLQILSDITLDLHLVLTELAELRMGVGIQTQISVLSQDLNATRSRLNEVTEIGMDARSRARGLPGTWSIKTHYSIDLEGCIIEQPRKGGNRPPLSHKWEGHGPSLQWVYSNAAGRGGNFFCPQTFFPILS